MSAVRVAPRVSPRVAGKGWPIRKSALLPTTATATTTSNYNSTSNSTADATATTTATEAPQALRNPQVNLPPRVTVTSLRRAEMSEVGR